MASSLKMGSSTKRCDASPGPVDGSEDVAYGLYSPDVFDPLTGELTPEAVKIDDLRGPSSGHIDLCGHSTGVSVCRLSGPDALYELRQVLGQIATRRASRRIEGYATAGVQQIWNIGGASEGMRALDVLDDGRFDYPSHAVIRAAPGLGRGALRGPKHDLLAILNARVVRYKE
jgi:hypothetical protein